MRKYNITKKACFSAALVLGGTMLIGMTALADGSMRRNNIKSKGIIDYANGEVVLDSSDLTYLADEVDALEHTYKQFVLEYLNGINTYLDAEGNVTHDWAENDISYFPTFSELLNGIDLSQEVNTGTTVDNLSKDKGAWVNGEYISGNGNDVNEAYLKGLKEGFDNAMEHCTISYVYHEHEGDPSTAGGCYQRRSGTCGGSLKVTSVGEPYFCDIPGHGAMHEHMEVIATCVNCGHSVLREGNQQPEFGSHFANAYVGYVLRYSRCDADIDYIELACGKTESTIESATIVFNQ